MAETHERSSADALRDYPSIAELVQTEDEKAYVNGMTAQHFKSEKDPETKTMGSCFYTESCPDSWGALELVADKLGKDDKADREKLVAAGTPQSSLLPFCRYYMIEGIRGKSRVVSVKELKDDQTVTLVKSPKGTPSLVIPESESPASALQDVTYGTVIVGPEKRNMDGKEVEGKAIWTMHAGHPVPMVPVQKNPDGSPARDEADKSLRVPDDFGWKYGDKLTVARIKEKLGEDAFVSIQ